MIQTLIQLLILCVVIGLIWWVVDYLPVPEPLNKLIKVVTIVIGAIIIIYALLGLAGVAPKLAASATAPALASAAASCGHQPIDLQCGSRRT